MSKLLPNFTPIPNILLDEWMSSLNGGEFKILMVIARQTYGWVIDNKTGRRKKSDWISYSQLCEKAGLTPTPVSSALRKLEELDYIEVSNEKGEILTTHEQRNGKKLFYGIIAQTTRESREVDDNLSKKSTRESRETKETYTKPITKVIGGKALVDEKIDKRNPDIQDGMDFLKELKGEVVKERLNRFALKRLYAKHGKEKVFTAFRFAHEKREEKFCPQIYNFMDLEEKWQKLRDFYKNMKNPKDNKKQPSGLFGSLIDLMEREGVTSI